LCLGAAFLMLGLLPNKRPFVQFQHSYGSSKHVRDLAMEVQNPMYRFTKLNDVIIAVLRRPSVIVASHLTAMQNLPCVECLDGMPSAIEVLQYSGTSHINSNNASSCHQSRSRKRHPPGSLNVLNRRAAKSPTTSNGAELRRDVVEKSGSRCLQA
jgi:hypothetical protein